MRKTVHYLNVRVHLYERGEELSTFERRRDRWLIHTLSKKPETETTVPEMMSASTTLPTSSPRNELETSRLRIGSVTFPLRIGSVAYTYGSDIEDRLRIYHSIDSLYLFSECTEFPSRLPYIPSSVKRLWLHWSGSLLSHVKVIWPTSMVHVCISLFWKDVVYMPSTLVSCTLTFHDEWCRKRESIRSGWRHLLTKLPHLRRVQLVDSGPWGVEQRQSLITIRNTQTSPPLEWEELTLLEGVVFSRTHVNDPGDYNGGTCPELSPSLVTQILPRLQTFGVDGHRISLQIDANVENETEFLCIPTARVYICDDWHHWTLIAPSVRTLRVSYSNPMFWSTDTCIGEWKQLESLELEGDIDATLLSLIRMKVTGTEEAEGDTDRDGKDVTNCDDQIGESTFHYYCTNGTTCKRLFSLNPLVPTTLTGVPQPTLSSLTLGNTKTTRYSYSIWKSVVPFLAHLQELRFKYTPFISATGYGKDVKEGKEGGGGGGKSSDYFASITETLVRLRHLSFSFTDPHVHVASLATVERLVHLKSCDLSFLTLDDDSVRCLGMSLPASLVSFSLSTQECTRVNNDAWRLLGSRTTRFQHLRLPRLRDESLVQVTLDSTCCVEWC